MRLRAFLAGGVLLLIFLWRLTERKPTEGPLGTETGDSASENALLARSHPDLMPEQVAILLLRPEQEALPAARALEPAGVPFTVTTDRPAAFRHRVVFVPFGEKAVRLDEKLRSSFSDFVSSGGVLVLQVPPENPWSWLTGVESAAPSRQRKKLSFRLLADPIFAKLVEPEEQWLPLGAPDSSEAIWTQGLRPLRESGAEAISDYTETGEGAIMRRRLGAGTVYTLGFNLRDLVVRPQAERHFDAARVSADGFEPAVDILALIWRALYEKSNPFWARLRASPEAGPLLLMTHSFGRGAQAAQAREFAVLESSRGIKSTWFLETRTGAENTDTPFFDEKMRTLAADLQRAGHEVASHGVSHGADFARLPLGGAQAPKDYRPEVDEEGQSLGATLNGEASVSKTLLEAAVSSTGTVLGFRGPAFAYPPALDAVLEKAGYAYDSSLAANACLTHFPFLLLKNRALSEESGIIEFPVTFRGAAAEEAAAVRKISAYEGAVVWDIPPDGDQAQRRRLVDALAAAPAGARWRTLSDAALFWRRRSQARFSFSDGPGPGQKTLWVGSPAGIGGLSFSLSARAKACAGDVQVDCRDATISIPEAVAAPEARIILTLE